MKSLQAVKATVIDDNTFRLLAVPFGGPIPNPHSPKGVDRTGQWFSENTDIKPDWLPMRLVDWHHRGAGYPGDKIMGSAIIGKALLDSELTPEEGWWVTVWMKHGERRVELIKTLAAKGAQLFGSSETLPGMPLIRTVKGTVVPWAADIPGEIVKWPYARQTLSTSPENTYSVLRPMKAMLDDCALEGIAPARAFFDDLARYLDDLATQPSGDLPSDPDAKAGRVLAARNEARLREGISQIEVDGWNPVLRKKALATFAEILDELERVTETVT